MQPNEVLRQIGGIGVWRVSEAQAVTAVRRTTS